MEGRDAKVDRLNITDIDDVQHLLLESDIVPASWLLIKVKHVGTETKLP